MGSANLTPQDLKQLPQDGARFEALIGQLLEAMGYRSLEKSAIGTEDGRDVLKTGSCSMSRLADGACRPRTGRQDTASHWCWLGVTGRRCPQDRPSSDS